MTHTNNAPKLNLNMACPGNKLRWDVNKDDFPRLTEELIASTKTVYDVVGALTKDEVNYDNVIKVNKLAVLQGDIG